MLFPLRRPNFLGQLVVRYLGAVLGSTLLVTVVSAALSFPLGVALGWARLGAGRCGRAVVGAWIDAMRAVPMLLLIYFFLLAVPNFGPTLPPFWKSAYNFPVIDPRNTM